MKQYRKRSYLAEGMQLSLGNQAEVLALLGEDACPYGLNCIVVRGDKGISTVHLGDFVVRGENGVVKSYAPASFFAKYEEV